MVKPGTSGVQSANHLQFDDLHMAGCATSGMTCYDYGLTNHPTERRKTKHLTHLGLPINWQIFIPQWKFHVMTWPGIIQAKKREKVTAVFVGQKPPPPLAQLGPPKKINKIQAQLLHLKVSDEHLHGGLCGNDTPNLNGKTEKWNHLWVCNWYQLVTKMIFLNTFFWCDGNHQKHPKTIANHQCSQASSVIVLCTACHTGAGACEAIGACEGCSAGTGGSGACGICAVTGAGPGATAAGRSATCAGPGATGASRGGKCSGTATKGAC